MSRNKPPCSASGCHKLSHARGLCHAHYKKWYAYGDAEAGGTRAPDGSGYIDAGGYHRRTAQGVERPEHVRIAEKALGKKLPPGAIVHHVDECKTNNVPTNLVVCTVGYHNMIHMRMRALAACGDPNWRKCCRCGEYDAPGAVHISGTQAYHPACNAAHVRAFYERRASA